MIGHAENFAEAPEMRVYGMAAYTKNAERSHGETLSPETRAWQNKQTAKAVATYRAEIEKRSARRAA